MIRAQVKAKAQIIRQQAKLSVYNAKTSVLNSRLCQVLTVATGDTQPKSTEDWYSWWNDYNEVATQGDKPFVITYRAGWEPIYTVATAPSLVPSCLVAGTPVWTELGPVAVEKIAVGDRVLACDCDTGQLLLKPVLKTIVNPGKDIFHIGNRVQDDHFPAASIHGFGGQGQKSDADGSQEVHCG